MLVKSTAHLDLLIYSCGLPKMLLDLLVNKTLCLLLFKLLIVSSYIGLVLVSGIMLLSH